MLPPRLRLAVLLGLGLFPSSSHARPLELSCPEATLVAQLASKAIASEHLGDPSSAISRTPERKCTVALSGLLKDRLKAFADKPSYVDGANCWGTTLYLAGLRKAYTYTHDKEFSASLDSSGRCRPLSREEVPQPGDIGAVRAVSDRGLLEERHGFLFLSPQLVISKLSFSHAAEAELAHPSTFWNRPGLGGRYRDHECQRFGGAKNCDSWTTYYRCRAGLIVEPYLEKLPELYSPIATMANELEFSWNDSARANAVARGQDRFLDLTETIYSAFESTPDSLEKKMAWAYFESLVWQFTAVQLQQRTPLDP